MTRTFPRLLLAGGLVAAAASLVAAAASAQTKYVTYENDRHGFSLTYPADKFVALPQSTPDGFQAVSRDGNARLLVGTISNFDGKSLAAYRTFLINAAYPGAKIDYAPVRATWFVVSGVRKDGITAFYQRVNFVCGGRNINSWAVLFPYAEEPVYSKIIEQMHRDYALGDGNCDKSAATMPARQQMGAMARVMSGAMEMEPKQMAVTQPAASTAMEPTTPQPKAMAAIEPAAGPKPMAALDGRMPPRHMGSAGRPQFATYSNDKHGFSLVYPAGQFLALPQATADLFQAVSLDGKARLQAGTLANFDGKSLGAYRSFLLKAAYPDARLDEAPARATGFVLSGVTSDGATGFYHRVAFVCGWRNINSLSLLYPAQEKPAYEKIIQQVDRDYVVGDGNCDAMASPATK